MLFPDGPHGGFLVVNQNQAKPIDGEIRHYDAKGRRLADLVFSPRGDLYIASFRQRSFDPDDPSRPDPNDPPKAGDNDRILILPKECLRRDRHGGRREHCRVGLDRIELWRADLHQERAYAQALLFGPHGDLYVPISSTGEVRRYDVDTKRYRTFIAAHSSGGTVRPQYLSFGRTNPATLAYDEPHGRRGE